MNSNIDLKELARGDRAEGYSGADLQALLREAGLACLREGGLDADENKEESLRIEKRHFEKAFEEVAPSVSKDDQREYDAIKERIGRARSRPGNTNNKG
jgi:SpoVK/Ycf46/Vps4 family AAA+-type ATPase